MPAGPAALFCDGLCSAAAQCGAPSDCETQCEGYRPGLVNLSADGARHVGACVARFDCFTLQDETAWKAGFDACWEQAKTELTPRAPVRSFCAHYSEAWFECDSWLSTSECEAIYGMWSDAVLDRVAACDSSSCDALDQCVQATFDSL